MDLYPSCLSFCISPATKSLSLLETSVWVKATQLNVRISMKKFYIFTLLLFLLTPFTSNGQIKEYEGIFAVSDSLVEIKIPIRYEENYIWYKRDIPANVAEYVFKIQLENYTFGFSLYKFFQERKEKKGNIKELFTDGQLDVWKRNGNSYSLLPDYRMKIFLSLPVPYIVLEISDPKTIKMLFDDTPETASFFVYGFETKYPEGTITIQYK